MRADIICRPTFPGWWEIKAGTKRGTQWWEEENFPQVDWVLGRCSFSLQEVETVVRAMPDGMTIEVNGLVRRTETVRLKPEEAS